MAFGINGPDPTPAIQKSHHTNDGGAGNLGYFQQEKKKKDDEDELDVVELSSKGENDEDDSKKDKSNSIGDKIKTFWFNLKGIFVEAVEEDDSEDNDNQQKNQVKNLPNMSEFLKNDNN